MSKHKIQNEELCSPESEIYSRIFLTILNTKQFNLKFYSLIARLLTIYEVHIDSDVTRFRNVSYRKNLERTS